MTSPNIWYRLCVDVDVAGNPIGSSYEAHANDRIVTLVVPPAPGPFDTPHEVLDSLVDEVLSRHGLQSVLF